VNNAALWLLSESTAHASRQLGRTRALCIVVGEFERWGSATFVWGPRSRVPTSTCGPALVGEGNYSCERVVGGGDFSREQVVRGEAESTRSRRNVVVQGRKLPCELPTSRR
jgi:hypothetical protein